MTADRLPKRGPLRLMATAWARRRPFTLLIAMFEVAWVESALELHADQWLPLWDKAVHVVAGAALAGLVAPHRVRAIWVVVGLGLLWELAQFVGQPFGGQEDVRRYYVDTAGDLIADVAGAAYVLLRARQMTRIRASASGS